MRSGRESGSLFERHSAILREATALRKPAVTSSFTIHHAHNLKKTLTTDMIVLLSEVRF